VHGSGWRLVTIDASPLEPGQALAEWFASIGGRTVVVDVASDTGDTYARWFAAHDATWALQRPDFHLYGAATDPGAARELLAHLHDRLMD
jgi:hypothetical protein